MGWNYPDWFHQYLVPGSKSIVNLSYKNTPDVKVDLNNKKQMSNWSISRLTNVRYKTEKGIPHDAFGFPVFGKLLRKSYPIGHVVFETDISPSAWNSGRIKHFKEANKLFKEKLEDLKNENKYNDFINKHLKIDSESQLSKTISNIYDDKNTTGTVEGFSWHHHQEAGRMQLVKRSTHNPLKHVGGFKIWGEGRFIR